jgi:hypothetical protein
LNVTAKKGAAMLVKIPVILYDDSKKEDDLFGNQEAAQIESIAIIETESIKGIFYDPTEASTVIIMEYGEEFHAAIPFSIGEQLISHTATEKRKTIINYTDDKYIERVTGISG